MFPLNEFEMIIMYWGSFFIICSVLYSVKDFLFAKTDGNYSYETEKPLTKDEFNNDYYHLWKSEKMGISRSSFSGVNDFPKHMKAILKNGEPTEYTYMSRNRKINGVYFDDFVYVGVGKTLAV